MYTYIIYTYIYTVATLSNCVSSISKSNYHGFLKYETVSKLKLHHGRIVSYHSFTSRKTTYIQDNSALVVVAVLAVFGSSMPLPKP